jgi:hypothetical protein
LVEEVRRIAERVSQQFLPLIEEARRREAAMTEEQRKQRKLRDDAQEWIQELQDIERMRASIFGTGQVPEKRMKHL